MERRISILLGEKLWQREIIFFHGRNPPILIKFLQMLIESVEDHAAASVVEVGGGGFMIDMILDVIISLHMLISTIYSPIFKSIYKNLT